MQTRRARAGQKEESHASKELRRLIDEGKKAKKQKPPKQDLKALLAERKAGDRMKALRRRQEHAEAAKRGKLASEKAR